ncbi:MAG: transporter substrate-binding domain-containing protein [Synergistaceae bacterium]|jgi:signal transduction histidine kinase/ABC-type amino acid transport substrate-binding protein/FixJ family two-component response regulator|nr:transporter substrate-binding domain-containing protein [Synergistaceae bacterium]
MRIITKIIYFFAAAAFLFCASRGVSEPLSLERNERRAKAPYLVVPGVTDEEILAIETLRRQTSGFVYGMNLTTETFYDQDGGIKGYSSLFCGWLTDLFGIPFKPEIYEWDELIDGLRSHEIDFCGELTATEERKGTYFMTDAIAERSVKLMRIAGSELVSNAEESRPPRYAFLEGVETYSQVANLTDEPFEPIFINNYDTAYRLLKSGEADAFFDESVAEAAFDRYDDVMAEDFFPHIYGPVSLSTRNPKLAPVISVVQKALQNGASSLLAELYKQGENDYLRHKLFSWLTGEEREYVRESVVSGRRVRLAAEYDNYPSSFYNERENEWQGVAFDVLREVKALTDLDFVVINDRFAEWPQLLWMLENGETQIITELVRSQNREGRFLWSDIPNQSDHYALLSRAEYDDISINEVLHLPIGIIKDTVYAEIFRDWFPNHANATEYANSIEAFDALERGEVDLVMASLNQLLCMTNFYERPGFKAIRIFERSYESFFGFNYEEKILASVVSKAMRLVDVKGISNRWARRVFDYRRKMERGQRLWLIGASILMLFVIALLFVLFLRRRQEGKILERTVFERTREIIRQDELLHAINDAAALLLAMDESEFEDTLRAGMERMARCVGVDRVRIWKSGMEDGALVYTQAFEWLEREIMPRSGSSDWKTAFPYIKIIPAWETKLSDGLCINGLFRNLSRAEQDLLAPYGILSFLVIPIFMEEKFWGFINFDNCHEEHAFSEDEESILRSGSLLLSNAVVRNETTRNLVRAREEAISSTKAKSAFLATVSHELRTPLNAIIGLSEVELRENLPQRTQSNLEKILNSGSNLLAIVNDILDISKIEAGGFEITPKDFDVATLINDIVQLNIVRIGSKNISFSLEIDENIPAKLHGDELRIKQVLNNLLSNAFKYTNEGRVIFRVHSRREDDSAVVRFTVMDTGVGIEREEIGKLFEAYSQMRSRPDHNIEGTGLGLSITKHLAQLMGGTISVKSKYGRGSVFIVTFRLKIADKTSIGSETADNLRRLRFMGDRVRGRRDLVRAYMPQGRVLVVDDVMTNLDVARGLMMPYGLTVDCVSGGREAIGLIRAISDDIPDSGKYDIIFMDHMMPGMDGVETTRVIRKEIGTEYARTVPIVALTANALSGSRDMFLRNGFNGFISKPIDIHRLDETLNQWVDKKERVKSPNGMIAQTWWDDIAGMRMIPDDACVDGIDFKVGVARYDGEENYLKIIRSYVRHTPKLIGELSVGEIESPTKDEMKAYVTVVHGLKGSSYGICADAVGKMAEALEHAARTGEWQTVRSGHDALIDMTNTLIAQLKELLKDTLEKSSGKQRGKPRRAAPDRVILEKMLSAARHFKTSQMEDLLVELEEFDYENETDLIGWLGEQISNIEYDAITERLGEILASEET